MATITQPRTIAELNHFQMKLFFSPAGYMQDSHPYMTDRDKKTMALVGELVQAERQQYGAVVHLIEKLDGTPITGSPDPFLAELNYLSFPFLLDLLIQETAKEIADFEARLPHIEGHAATEAARDVIAMKTTFLKRMRDQRESAYSEDPPAPEVLIASAPAS